MRKPYAFLLVIAVLAIASMALYAHAPAASKQAATPAAASPDSGKVYVCDKCDAAFDKPGKCPCGRELKAVDKSDIYYQCDMCKVKSDKAGKCPKCGMDMKLHVASWEKAKAAATKS